MSKKAAVNAGKANKPSARKTFDPGKDVKTEVPQGQAYPRREPGGWVIAPDTPTIPASFWPFFSYDPIQAEYDDPFWGSAACQCVRIMVCLDMYWDLSRTREMQRFFSRLERALRVAMVRVTVAADIRLTQAECDAIEDGFAAVLAGLDAYGNTSANS